MLEQDTTVLSTSGWQGCQSYYCSCNQFDCYAAYDLNAIKQIRAGRMNE